MRNLLFIITMCVLAGGGTFIVASLVLTSTASAVPVESTQDREMALTGGDKLGTAAVPIPVSVEDWTGWMNTLKYSKVVLDLLYDRDGPGVGTATSIDMRCQSSESSLTLNGAGKDLHVLTSTSSAGISLSKVHRWRNPVDGGPDDEDGLANDEEWSWIVTNPPSSFLNCGFISVGGDPLNDLIHVRVRAISP